MWFVATAPLGADGHVNVSPLGHGTFSVLDSHRVAWVDFTGSGVETIAHIRENGRVCLMFTSFDKRPRIASACTARARCPSPATRRSKTSSLGIPRARAPEQ